MGLSFAYGTSVGEDESLAVLARAAELPPSLLLDTADEYGPYTNDKLICEYCCIVQLCTCPPLMSLGTSRYTVID